MVILKVVVTTLSDHQIPLELASLDEVKPETFDRTKQTLILTQKVISDTVKFNRIVEIIKTIMDVESNVNPKTSITEF